MNRNRFVISLLALILFCLQIQKAHTQGTIEQIFTSGATDKRINLVFLSEGYTDSQLPRYIINAKNMWSSLRSTQPFSDYRNFFNVYAISIASQESGSDHPSSNIYRDTYFNSSFDWGGIARLIGINQIGEQRAHDLLINLMPEYDHAILIVNDSMYGGAGGQIALTSIHPASPQVVIHEFGHSMAYLADEYSDAIPNPPSIEKPNVTTETRRDFIKWRIWIDHQTPIPTPQTNQFNGVIGLFEGANYRTTGWYRPKLSCKMRSLGSPFCDVCVETIIKSIYSLIQPIESYQPQNATLTIRDTSVLFITTELMNLLNNSYLVEWFVDGKRAITSNPDTLILDAKKLSEGIHKVEVDVADTTSLVRNDPLSLLKEYLRWDVIVQRSTNVEPSTSSKEQHRTVLLNNYPNPVSARSINSTIQIVYSLPQSSFVTLNVTDVFGREIQTLVNGYVEAGKHYATFNATSLPSGMYVYTLQAGKYTKSRTMIFMK